MLKRSFCICLAAILLFSGGCGRGKNNGENLVVASFYPVYIFTLNLLDGIDDITVQNMTEGVQSCLHDYQLTTKDMKLLADADLLVINGAGMENFIEKALAETGDLTVADSSGGVALLYAGDLDHDDHTGHTHDTNPHIWLSVPNAIMQVNNIYDALVGAFPDHFEAITQNRNQYVGRLDALHSEVQAAAATLRSPVVVFHNAYDYFSREYAIPVLAGIESSEGGEPSAKELGGLKELIEQNEVRALFVEPDYSGTSAKVLANETGAALYTLNPMTSGNSDKSAYENIMRNNIQTLLDAENNR